jgi:hypothetical protein
MVRITMSPVPFSFDSSSSSSLKFRGIIIGGVAIFWGHLDTRKEIRSTRQVRGRRLFSTTIRIYEMRSKEVVVELFISCLSSCNNQFEWRLS